MRELDYMPDHQHPGVSREFIPKDVIDTRSLDQISIESVFAEVMQYVQSKIASKSPITTEQAWGYAKEAYEYLDEIDEVPYIRGDKMSLHMYQAYFMLAFDIKMIANIVVEQGVDTAKFMEDANQLALEELANS